MNILFLWFGEDAVETERLTWEHIRSSEAMQDVEFHQAETRAQFEIEHEQLIKEGWVFKSAGSGSWSRIYSYAKSEANSPADKPAG